jgi:hypothetical protein
MKNNFWEGHPIDNSTIALSHGQKKPHYFSKSQGPKGWVKIELKRDKWTCKNHHICVTNKACTYIFYAKKKTYYYKHFGLQQILLSFSK